MAKRKWKITLDGFFTSHDFFALALRLISLDEKRQTTKEAKEARIQLLILGSQIESEYNTLQSFKKMLRDHK